MSKNDKRMGASEKEKCPKCGSTIYAKATDKSGKYYCQAKGCQHVWIPGAEALKRPDVMIQKLQIENQQLAAEVTRLRKDKQTLTEEVAALQAELAKLDPNRKPAEAADEIFT